MFGTLMHLCKYHYLDSQPSISKCFQVWGSASYCFELYICRCQPVRPKTRLALESVHAFNLKWSNISSSCQPQVARRAFSATLENVMEAQVASSNLCEVGPPRLIRCSHETIPRLARVVGNYWCVRQQSRASRCYLGTPGKLR